MTYCGKELCIQFLDTFSNKKKSLGLKCGIEQEEKQFGGKNVMKQKQTNFL